MSRSSRRSPAARPPWRPSAQCRSEASASERSRTIMRTLAAARKEHSLGDLTPLLLIGYAVTGLIAGTLGGLIGIGGGVIVVPALTLIFHKDAQLAVAASLFQMIFIATSSAYGHYRNGYILKSVVVRLVPVAAVAAIVGAIRRLAHPRRHAHEDFRGVPALHVHRHGLQAHHAAPRGSSPRARRSRNTRRRTNGPFRPSA